MELPYDQMIRLLRYRNCLLTKQVNTIVSNTNIIGITGNGGSDDPIIGNSTYINIKLKNIATTTNKFTVSINGNIWTSFNSANGNKFDFDRTTYTVTFPFQFNSLDFIQIDLNQQ